MLGWGRGKWSVSQKHTLIRIFLPPLPLDGMLVHRRVSPSSKFAGYPFIHLGEERYCESEESCPRTQSSTLAGARTWIAQFRVQRNNHWANTPSSTPEDAPQKKKKKKKKHTQQMLEELVNRI